MGKCIICGKKFDTLYGGYCIKCFQTVKMEQDKDAIDDSDCYIEENDGSASIDELFRMSNAISERLYMKGKTDKK